MPDSRALMAVAALVTLPLVGCGNDKSLDNEKSASLTQPVARVELKVEKAAPGSRTGEQIYESVCASCHSSGALDAPKTGDNAAWAPRIALGLDALVSSATNGKNAMPPKGGATDLTDTELVRAVAYLANQSGGSFEEPSVDGAAPAEAASAEAASAEAVPAEAAPAEAAPAEAAPAEAAPAEAAPAEAAPAEAAPAEAAPAEAAPAEAAPAEAAPAEAAPAEAAPADATPATAAPANSGAGEALAKEKNCLACHKVDAKLVGPSYQDVAEKYGAQGGAADMLAEKIQKGSSGVWGPIPMPPNQVSPEEAKLLAEWVLSLKK